MFQGWVLVAISLVYIAVLFSIAWWGDNRAKKQVSSHQKKHPYIYSLALAVYCTSWSFYGTVGQATHSSWIYLSIFLGPIIMYLVFSGLIRKIIRVSKKQNITSIADFIASRYGKTQGLAVLVTLIALVGTLPYIALQLKAVAMSYNVITTYPDPMVQKSVSLFTDTAFYVAIMMAIFAIFFGTRHIDATEHHQGLVLAIAFESIVKLIAFMTVGAYITYGMFNGFNDLLTHARYYLEIEKELSTDPINNGFIAQTILAMLAILCLPRQFHMAVVENTHVDDSRTARWVFPSYLFAISFFVLPIAAAGLLIFPDGTVEPDTFVLTLPMAAQESVLTLLAFLGGFSAATSMVILATIAISIMVSNDIVIPLLLKFRWSGNTSHHDFGQMVLHIRRITIICILALAYLSYQVLAEFNSLAATGLLSFAAVAQFGPALIGGMYWKRGNRYGALAGMSVGFIIWAYSLLLPSIGNAGWVDPYIVAEGPFNIYWLKPDALFGVQLDYLTHGVLFSLGFNLFFYVAVSNLTKQRVIDRIQASAFIDSIDTRNTKTARPWLGSTSVGDLMALCERFLGPESVDKAFADYFSRQNQTSFKPDDRASIEVIQFTERLLAGVLGASSARIVTNSALQGKEIQISDVISIVDEASQVLEFNRALLQATIENISQGISVVDHNLRLVVWNQHYLDLFNFPDNMIRVGEPIENIFRFNAQTGEYGLGNPEEQVQQLLDNIRQGEPHRYIRYRRDGTVLDVQGNPMPGGGFVYTYQDITQQKQTEEALIQSENNIRIYTDNVPALIAYFDIELRYLFTNKAYEEAMHVDRNAIIGQPMYKVLTLSQYEARKPYIDIVLQGQRAVFELEHSTNQKQVRYGLVTYTPHRNDKNEILGFFALYQDITERRKAEIALKETNETLEERVKDRTQELSDLNQDLMQAKQVAELANASKTRFLAAASHDLLQPLNAARLFTSALAHQVKNDNADQYRMIKNIDGSLKAAEELLSTLLDISKLDAGALLPNISTFRLDTILKPLAAEFGVMASNRGLHFDSVKTASVVKSDAQMLRRIIQNFLSNAARYTQHGKILLGCRRMKNAIRIEVWDTGPGIPAEKLSEIFQEFKRLDHPERHNKESEKGLGLGLSIADRMGRVLNHPIKVRSWPGQGTVFSVEVALGDSADLKPEITQDSVQGLASQRNNPLAGLHVLCIDNEPLILEGMEAMLSNWQCRVSKATTIGGAKSVIRNSGRPDIVLADYHLDNDVTGMMALSALNELFDEPLPAILITADRTEEVAESIKSEGYTLLHKPLKPAPLRAMATRVLKSHKVKHS
ncbi:PAS domain S-box-containing protein [Oceanospirillum multiglobuliferum]|uniref:histidine kinase n=1 Tax=Oceanospirillum multiglobuliferum TaxID=64969 RepID=A0A1T4L9F6_9GAMM|nr:NahK/ErcS family hybrid sensor histidine kinase/response regulator [Oceanospirillum multiglobuliferum]OPX56749.1 hybrid sensor histidine kinase/response regulator [Oceanospirillum multiglobuliferum]SJZ51230.1 PAS domain S-box-containing protein [Oceanospirillum multiglobuliferum]